MQKILSFLGTCWVATSMLTACWSGRVLADELESKIPDLQRHSKNSFSIFQGDKIKVSVDATGENLLYRWVRNYKTICRKEACLLDSSRWGVGKQSLTVVVYNKFGSRSINFVVRVLSRPIGKDVSEFEPPMVEAAAAETVSVDDFFVRALAGIGYSYRDGDVKVIAKIPRLLFWEERVRSHIKGTLQFGVKDQEEHILHKGGVVKLAKTSTERRVVLLKKGLLRSRQISPVRPNWSILVDQWVQVDGDEKADLLIRRKNATQVTVTVLRGNARVYYRESVAASLKEGKVVTIPSGISVDLEQGSQPSEYHRAKYKDMRSVVMETSPQYFLRAKTSKSRRKGMFLSANIKAHKGKSLEESLLDASKTLAEGDYFLTLENLLPVFNKGKGNYDYNMMVAKSYRGLQLFRPALRFFNQAKKAESGSGEPSYQIGLMYVEARMWAKAEKSFLEARKKGALQTQLLNYYLGVCQYNLDRVRDAQVSFEYSLWQATEKHTKQSAQDFLQMIKGEDWIGAVGVLGFGQDSNVFRWGGGERTESYTTAASAFYRGFGSLYYKPYRGTGGTAKIGFDIEKVGFLGSGVDVVDRLTQRLYVDTYLKFFQDENLKAAFTFSFEPYLQLFSLGEERAADMYGINVGFGSQTVWGQPHLSVGYGFLLDPIPGRDDLLDPVLLEPVSPSDRSAMITRYDLDLLLMDTPDNDIGLTVHHRSVSYSDETSEAESFSEIGAKVASSFRINPSFYLGIDPGYFSRSFGQSDDGRKDSGFFADLGAKYYFTYSVSSGLQAHYRSQSSSRDLSSYNQYLATLNFSLEL